jgi:hypothetical protein
MSLIPFDEIVPGASVRCVVIDNTQYLSIRDIIMHMCDRLNDHAGKTWRDLKDDFKNEIKELVKEYQFPGRGQSAQPVITFPGALKLSMFLPGENAKRHRSSMAKILERFFAGDKSLLAEIEANAVSMHPVAQMARESLWGSTFDTRALELRKQHLEIDGLELEIERRRIENKKQKMDNIQQFQSLMMGLRNDQVLDVRTRLKLEDMAKNDIMQPDHKRLALENGESNNLKSISIGEVAAAMGYKNLAHGDSIRIGNEATRLYREKHGEAPSKHAQWVDGAERMINSYTEQDRDILEKAVKNVKESAATLNFARTSPRK